MVHPGFQLAWATVVVVWCLLLSLCLGTRTVVNLLTNVFDRSQYISGQIGLLVGCRYTKSTARHFTGPFNEGWRGAYMYSPVALGAVTSLLLLLHVALSRSFTRLRCLSFTERSSQFQRGGSLFVLLTPGGLFLTRRYFIKSVCCWAKK